MSGSSPPLKRTRGLSGETEGTETAGAHVGKTDILHNVATFLHKHAPERPYIVRPELRMEGSCKEVHTACISTNPRCQVHCHTKLVRAIMAFLPAVLQKWPKPKTVQKPFSMIGENGASITIDMFVLGVEPPRFSMEVVGPTFISDFEPFIPGRLRKTRYPVMTTGQCRTFEAIAAHCKTADPEKRTYWKHMAWGSHEELVARSSILAKNPIFCTTDLCMSFNTSNSMPDPTYPKPLDYSLYLPYLTRIDFEFDVNDVETLRALLSLFLKTLFRQRIAALIPLRMNATKIYVGEREGRVLPDGSILFKPHILRQIASREKGLSVPFETLMSYTSVYKSPLMGTSI